MKKTFLISALAVWGLTSCTTEDLAVSSPDGATVSFTAELPTGLASRAYGDGSVAKTLHYAVYEVAETDPEGRLVMATDVAESNAPAPEVVSSKQFKLTLNLVKGKTYDFIFWADAAEDSPYTFSSSSRSVSVSYGATPVPANDDSRDAFFHAEKALKVDGGINRTISLKRPFAQMNVGTSDIEAAAAVNATIAKVETTVEGVHNALNLYTGIASGEETVAFVAETTDGQISDQAFPVSGYDYLAMNYLLSGTELEGTDIQRTARELMNASLAITLNDGQEISVEVPNMPVQRNYRTNIYGALLTAPLNYTINVSPGFNSGDNNIEVWDGSVTVPTPDYRGNYTLKTASEFAGLVELVKNSDDGLAGKTVSLNTDIDLDGKAWTSIGTSTKKFAGIFDGKNHKIKGLNSPVFAYVSGATIKDVQLDVENCAAAVATNTYGDVTISGVTVDGSAKGSINGTGGLVAYARASGNAETGTLIIDNCVNNAEIHDPSYCGGGLIGRAAVPVSISNSSNYGKVTSTRSSLGKAAGFVGMPSNYPVTIENCHNYGDIAVNTSQMAAAGGFVGWTNSGVTIIGSTNKGNITVNVSNVKEIVVVGGLYGGSGWDTGKKTFTDCSNSGNITVVCNGMKVPDGNSTDAYQYGAYVGGIMGFGSYNDAEITGCAVSGNYSVETNGDDAQSQYISALSGAFGWENNVTVTGNTISAGVNLTGNQNENTHLTPYFFNLSSNKNIVLENNENNTSYEQ